MKVEFLPLPYPLVVGVLYWLERLLSSRKTWIGFPRRVRPKDFKSWYSLYSFPALFGVQH